MAPNNLSGTVYTYGEHVGPLGVRLVTPGAAPLETRLDESGRFSLSVSQLESRADEDAMTDPGRYQQQLQRLGISEFLAAQGEPLEAARAVVAQILYEDPELLVDDPSSLPGRLEVFDAQTGEVVARHDFYPAVDLVDEPTSLELATEPLGSVEPSAATSTADSHQAQQRRLQAGCALRYDGRRRRSRASSFWRSAAKLIRAEGWQIVFWEGDELQGRGGPRMSHDKTIHQFGVVAPFEFVPENSGYDGVFGRAGVGIIRLGLALNDSNLIVPGLAIKFPVSGTRSVNVVALPSAQGQGDDHNFFASSMLTEVAEIPPPSSGSSFKERMFLFGLRKLEQRVSSEVSQGSLRRLPLQRVFSITQDGAPVDSPVPRLLEFRPSQSARRRYLDAGGRVLRRLASLEVGKTLFDVHAVDRNQHGEVVRVVLLGRVVLGGELVESPYGDRELHFHHDYPPS